MKGVHGTSYYIAPEVISNKQYDERCDIWSIGVILYILISGRPPFDGNNDDEIAVKVKKGKFDLQGEPWDSVSSEVKELIKIMLTHDYKKRIYADDALKHPWFKNATPIQVNSEIVKNTLLNMSKFNAT